MANYLSRLRNLPENTQRKIMWMIIGTIMLVIFILWLSFLLPKSISSEKREKDKNLEELKGQLQETFKNIKEIQKQFSKLKRKEKISTETVSHFSSQETKSEEPRPRLPLE